MTQIDTKDGEPVYDCKGLSPADIFLEMHNECIQFPCWLQVGRSHHRIPLEDKRGFFRGMVIAMELKDL